MTAGRSGPALAEVRVPRYRCVPAARRRPRSGGPDACSEVAAGRLEGHRPSSEGPRSGLVERALRSAERALPQSGSWAAPRRGTITVDQFPPADARVRRDPVPGARGHGARALPTSSTTASAARAAGGADELVDRPREVAAGAEALLEPVEAVLPPGGAGLGGQAVLEEEEPTVGTQDTADLPQGTVGPLPKPSSTTSPRAPARTRSRRARTSGVPRATSVIRGTTCSAQNDTGA